MEISFGQYPLPVILTLVLGIVFKYWESLGDRFKPLIAIALGIGLGLVGMFYNITAPYAIPVIIDHVLYGLMAGAAAVGLYEGLRSFKNPRL